MNRNFKSFTHHILLGCELPFIWNIYKQLIPQSAWRTNGIYYYSGGDGEKFMVEAEHAKVETVF